MKYQILFSGKNKKYITSVLSVELAQRVVKINILHLQLQVRYFFQPNKKVLFSYFLHKNFCVVDTY